MEYWDRSTYIFANGEVGIGVLIIFSGMETLPACDTPNPSGNIIVEEKRFEAVKVNSESESEWSTNSRIYDDNDNMCHVQQVMLQMQGVSQKTEGSVVPKNVPSKNDMLQMQRVSQKTEDSVVPKDNDPSKNDNIETKDDKTTLKEDNNKLQTKVTELLLSEIQTQRRI